MAEGGEGWGGGSYKGDGKLESCQISMQLCLSILQHPGPPREDYVQG